MTVKDLDIIDSKKIEENFLSLFMQSPNWVSICSINDGTIIKANNRFSQELGFNPDEIVGKSIFNLDFIKKQKEFRKEIETLKEKKSISKKLFEIKTRKKGVRKGFLSLSTLNTNNQSYFTFVFDDMTTIVKIQEQLIKSEERLRGIFENVLAGFYIISSKTGKLIDCNDFFAHTIGFSNTEDAIGINISDLLVNPNDLKRINEIQNSDHFVDELAIKSQSGQIVWVMIYTFKQAQGGNLEGVIIDITERKKMEELNKISEYRFRTLIENTSDLIFIISPLGHCTYVSPSINKVLGYSKKINLNNIFTIIPNKDHSRFNNFLKEICGPSNDVHKMDILVNHKNGTYRTISVTASNFLNVPEIGGIILNAQDITDKVKAQEEISLALWKEQELNRQKTQFISTVSHDFRTPLTNISLNIQLLERYIEDQKFENISKNIERMSNATKRLTALLNEVSLISKEQCGRLAFNPETFNSSFLIDLIVEQVDYLFQPNVSLSISKESIVEVKADRGLITHIVDNLLSNAIKFSPDKSPIYFSMGINNSGVLNVSVKDNGIGIPTEELKFLFDPYFRASNVDQILGNGLGLSIVKRCVNLHHGIISITSKKSRGTTVKVTIPLNI